VSPFAFVNTTNGIAEMDDSRRRELATLSYIGLGLRAARVSQTERAAAASQRDELVDERCPRSPRRRDGR